MAIKDIIFDANKGGLQIANGDLDDQISDEYHIQAILSTTKGQYKQQPLIGVDLDKQINGSTPIAVIEQLIREALSFDNYVVKQVGIEFNRDTGALLIDPDAVRREIL